MFSNMDHQYHYMSYNKVGGRTTTQQRGRGFRLNHRRFSVYRFRAKFLYFIRVLSRWRWKFSFGSLKKGIISGGSTSRSCKRSDSRRVLARDATGVPQDYKLRSYSRSNSFYSEAIADCLEFIKRSSVSVDDENSCGSKMIGR